MRGFPAIELSYAVVSAQELLSACTFNYYPYQLIGPDANVIGSFGFISSERCKTFFLLKIF